MKINIDFIPIIGELGPESFVLNFVSYVNSTVIVNGTKYPLKTHRSTRCVLPHDSKHATVTLSYGGTSYLIRNTIPEDPSSSVNVFNCDCQFLPETGAWDDVSASCLSFHLGDQVYLDHIFMKLVKGGCCSSELTDDLIRECAYNEYRVNFIRKLKVLQGSFNVMLGDDHDIADESLRDMYDKQRTEQVTRVLKAVFKEIGGGLRLTQNEVVHYGNSSFLLIDNIDILDEQSYSDNVISILDRCMTFDGGYRKSLYIMSARVMMNDRISAFYRWIYSCGKNTVSYKKLYDILFNLSSSVYILCGDAHLAKRFEVLKSGSTKIIEILFVGTMNSALDPYDGHEYLNIEGYRANQILKRVEHSHVALRNGRMKHVFTDSFINKNCGFCMYVTEYLCLKI